MNELKKIPGILKKQTLLSMTGTAMLALFGLLFWTNCTKSTPFGADLLGDELADYVFTDTLTVQCTTVREDSVATSDRTSLSSYLLCGQLKDPVFGTTTADVFTLMELSRFSPNFKNNDGTFARFDSIVLYLRIKSDGIYGDTLQNQTFVVSRLNPGNLIRWEKNYYSTNKFDADEVLGSSTVAIRPSKTDSLVYFDGKTRSVQKGTSFIRIPLKESFGRELLEHPDTDSLAFANDSLFWEKLRGLKISTSTPDSRALMALDLNNTSFSRVSLYYTRNDTIPTHLDLYFTGGNKFVNFQHDYTGSLAGASIDQPNQDLLYLQGTAGLKVKIDIPYAKNLGKIAVNKAELNLTAAALPSDNSTWYPAARQLLLTDTSNTLISDVIYSAGSLLNQGFGRFGGTPVKKTVNGEEIRQYSLILSQRFQEMVDQGASDLKGTSLYINVYPQYTSASRTVFYGPRNSTFPAKLNIKYTKIQ